MHELGLCEGVIDAVERRARGRRVRGVRVRAGVLHRVDPDSFRQAFALLAEGSVAEGAAVELVVVPARLSCRVCGSVLDTDQVLGSCPRCHSGSVDLTGGDELTLESITLVP